MAADSITKAGLSAIPDAVARGLDILGAPLAEIVQFLGQLEGAARFAVFSGSLAEGYGNPRSDIDMVAIVSSVESIAALDHNGFKAFPMPAGETVAYHFLLGGGVRLQVKAVPIDELSKWRDIVAGYCNNRRSLIETGTRRPLSKAEKGFQEEDKETYHRILSGTPLFGLEEAREALAPHFATEFANYLLLDRSLWLDGTVEDLLGLMESPTSSDSASVQYLQYTCLRRVGWMMLAAAGGTKVSEKFLFRALERYSDQIGRDLLTSWHDRTTSVTGSFAQGDDSTLAIVNECVERCRQLNELYAQYLQATNALPYSVADKWTRKFWASQK